MRDRVRESAFTSLLASKRFVVSVCAAIAMVLGAISAGASVFTGVPADARQAQAVPVNAVFKEAPNSPSVSNETPLFAKRQTLASHNIAVQPPLYTAETTVSKEKKGLNLKLNQDVVKSTNVLFYNPETPLPAADATPPITVTAPAPSDSTETTPPATPTEPPAQPATIEPQDPAPAAPVQPTDPTTEPSLNSVAPQPTDDTKQQ